VTDRSHLVHPLLRTRQIREFTDEPVSEADLTLLADVARWSGSSAHPSEAARRPKSAPGTARLPRDEVIFNERWPEG
jgi:nitroreductase